MKKITSLLAALLLVTGITAVAGIPSAFAAGKHEQNSGRGMHQYMQSMHIPWGHMGTQPFGIVGTVTAKDGTTLTVQSPARPNADETVYTVDARDAVIHKNGATTTLSAVAIHDTVMVRGTVDGTHVDATLIRDGAPGWGDKKGHGVGDKRDERHEQLQALGTGEPVIAGTVTSIGNKTITVKTEKGISYTVDTSDAVVHTQGATTTAAAIAQDDHVVVQGTFNGTDVDASLIIDRTVPTDGKGRGFFRGLFGFFTRGFGFF